MDRLTSETERGVHIVKMYNVVVKSAQLFCCFISDQPKEHVNLLSKREHALLSNTLGSYK